MKLSELTLDLIRQAYEQTGCTPGPFFCMPPHETRVCPLEAVSRFRGIKYWANVLDSRDETADFTSGYDGLSELQWSHHLTPAFYLGRQVRNELKGERK